MTCARLCLTITAPPLLPCTRDTKTGERGGVHMDPVTIAREAQRDRIKRQQRQNELRRGLTLEEVINRAKRGHRLQEEAKMRAGSSKTKT